MEFERAENLWWLLLIAPICLVWAGNWKWKQRVNQKLIDARLSKVITRSSSARLQVAKQALQILAIAFLIVASAQPQWGETNKPIKRTGVDVVFALDLSKSMLVADAKPSRLQAAKHEIEQTLRALGGDRVGLVVFTAISFQQSPLTTDYGALRFYLKKLHPNQMPVGGTSVGRAVVDSVELLTGRKVGADEGESVDQDSETKRAKNQIIVLITDGEDHESDPEAAAELARQNNVRIVSVGLGSPQGAKIPILKEDGTVSGYKRDEEGSIVQSKLDETTLKKLASMTDGKYLRYQGTGSVSQELVAYVDSLEKSEIESLLKSRLKERYYFFLVPAIFCLLVSLLLGDRRRKVTIVAMVFSFVGTLGCDRPFEDTLGSVDEGNALVEQGKFADALEKYRTAESEVPARPDLHFNLGRAHLGVEDFDAAQRAYARALESDDITLQFDAANNLGLALAGKEDWKGALATFADAMSLAIQHPGAIAQEKLEETRWNAEVAWMKLFPPCSALEDEFEDNDSAADAKPHDAEADPAYSLCGGDPDWFSIPAIPGTTVSVEVTFEDLREEPDDEAPFINANTDVHISLFDNKGDETKAVDQRGTDTFESVVKSRKTVRKIEKFVVTDAMVSTDDPAIRLQVAATEGLEFGYKIKIVAIPPCRALEEESEDNDNIAEAAPIADGEHQFHHCPGDEDWFLVQTGPGEAVFVDLISQPDLEREVAPGLNVSLFDPSTERILSDSVTEAGLVTTGTRTAPGPVAIRVSGIDRDQQGPYQLVVYRFAECNAESGVNGDDRFEENDSANSATPLDMAAPTHRYLRICPGDTDFYKLTFPEDSKDKRVQMGLSQISTPAAPTDEPAPEFTLDVVSESGDQILVQGQPVVTADPESPLPLHLAVISEPIEEESTQVRVSGGDDFYHLVQLNPQQPPSENQDEQQEESPDQNEGSEDQEQPDESEKDDSGEPESDQKDESEEGEQGDAEEQQAENGEEKETEAVSPAEQSDPEKEQLEDLMEALEQSDDNFQLKKALERVPNRYIPKDW